MNCDVKIARVARFLRHDFKLIIGRIFKENEIFFDEETFFKNTSVDFEQLVQEAFCYGANMTPPGTSDKLKNAKSRII